MAKNSLKLHLRISALEFKKTQLYVHKYVVLYPRISSLISKNMKPYIQQVVISLVSGNKGVTSLIKDIFISVSNVSMSS